MVEWLPLEPLVDFAFRHGFRLVPESDYAFQNALLGIGFAYNVYKWEKQKKLGRRRDAKDREQDSRLDRLEGKKPPMFPLQERTVGGFRFGQTTWYTLHHLGTDYRAAKGTPLYAPFDGEIIAEVSGLQGGKMIYYRSDWDNGKVIRFLHLDSYSAPKGRVSKGQEIARTGNTGILTTGAHLHLDINQNPSALLKGDLSFKNFVDPEGYNWAGPEVNVPVEAPALPQLFAPFTVDLAPSQVKRDEVKRMQRFLEAKGFLAIADAEMGYYGKKTQAAVDKFQKANGITRATQYGWWYPATRAKANSQLT